MKKQNEKEMHVLAEQESSLDPNGSYTGKPYHQKKEEKPVQDADDL